MHLIELGFRCNNACVFCAQGRLRELAPVARVDSLFERLESVRAGDVVAFVGGEPTLSDELPVLIERARLRGASSVLIQTNARRLAVAGYAESLAEAGASALDVSLHGANEPTHDYHTQAPDSFRQTVAGLRRARAARLAFGTTTVITRSNFRHLADIVRVSHSLGARAVRMQTAAPRGTASRNASSVVPSWPMVRRHLRRAVALARHLGMEQWAPELGPGSTPAVEEWFAGPGTFEEPVLQSTVTGRLALESIALAPDSSRRLHGPCRRANHRRTFSLKG